MKMGKGVVWFEEKADTGTSNQKQPFRANNNLALSTCNYFLFAYSLFSLLVRAAEKGLSVTLMERLVDRYGDQITTMLTVQYRSGESVQSVYGAVFDNLFCGEAGCTKISWRGRRSSSTRVS